MACCPNPVFQLLVLDCNGTIRPIRANESILLPAISGSALEVITVTSNYNAPDGPIIILCDATSAAMSVTLPSPVEPTEIVIKKIDASANIITVIGMIDGAASRLLSSQWDAITVIADGTAWYII